MEIRPITVDELKSDTVCSRMLAEYAVESSIDGMPEYRPDWTAYESLEKASMLHVVGTYYGDKLAGFATILVVVNPHYSATIAVVESLFVLKHYRSKGAGIAIINYIEQYAKQCGAVGVFINSPYMGRLDKYLTGKKSYKPTNKTFFKGLI